MQFDDVTFATQLEQAIRRTLSGDDKTPGLYTSLRGSPNWDAFLRTVGLIQGLEQVLGEMRRIAQRMNGDKVERRESERMVN